MCSVSTRCNGRLTGMLIRFILHSAATSLRGCLRELQVAGSRCSVLRTGRAGGGRRPEREPDSTAASRPGWGFGSESGAAGWGPWVPGQPDYPLGTSYDFIKSIITTSASRCTARKFWLTGTTDWHLHVVSWVSTRTRVRGNEDRSILVCNRG
jgi:hypothetical protein